MIFCARATRGRPSTQLGTLSLSKANSPRPGLMARLGLRRAQSSRVPVGGRVRKLRAVEDQSAPIPKNNERVQETTLLHSCSGIFPSFAPLSGWEGKVPNRAQRGATVRSGASASKKNGLPAPSHHSEAARCACMGAQQTPAFSSWLCLSILASQHGGLVDPRLRASNEHIPIVRVPRAGGRPGHPAPLLTALSPSSYNHLEIRYNHLIQRRKWQSSPILTSRGGRGWSISAPRIRPSGSRPLGL